VPAAATTRSTATPATAPPARSASAATTGSTAKAATTGCTARAGPTPSTAAPSPTRYGGDGDDGDDLPIGAAGGDILIGGNGIDTVSFASAGGGVRVSLTGSPNAQTSDAQGDIYREVEAFTGSAFADLMIGDEAANTFAGGAGNDTASGGGGNDRLIGGDGGDVLNGDAGNDLLRGGGAADRLFGGLGADIFDFDTAADSGPGARDVLRGGVGIAAFEGIGAAGGDRIDLSGIDANANVAGNQAFAFGGVGIGHVSLVNAGASTLVRCNTDADAAFELQILIEDGAARSGRSSGSASAAPGSTSRRRGSPARTAATSR
jgi:Ca2+-binding RTX toxin-like protein